MRRTAWSPSPVCAVSCVDDEYEHDRILLSGLDYFWRLTIVPADFVALGNGFVRGLDLFVGGRPAIDRAGSVRPEKTAF
jgi:hypothetical protein